MNPDPGWAKFAGVLDALNCGAAILDRNGKFTFVNARLAEMLRRPQASLAGISLIDLYGANDGCAVLREVLAHFDEAREGASLLPLPDGGRLPVMMSSRPLPSETHWANHRVVTMIDITPQKKVEEELQKHYRIAADMADTVLEQALLLKARSVNLEARVEARTAELRQANLDTIYMLAVASEARDSDTGRHLQRIKFLSISLASEMGMPQPAAQDLGYAAVLHDVGKIHIPDEVLKKAGPLTAEERRAMQEHTVIGERMLSDRPFFAKSRRIARSHHENWDGSGYPDGLSGKAIPKEARIVHVADVFDALVNARVYKPAWEADKAADTIRESSGRMFDPLVVKAFDTLFERGALFSDATLQPALK